MHHIATTVEAVMKPNGKTLLCPYLREKGGKSYWLILRGRPILPKVEVRSVAPHRWRGQPRHYDEGPGSLVGRVDIDYGGQQTNEINYRG